MKPLVAHVTKKIRFRFFLIAFLGFLPTLAAAQSADDIFDSNVLQEVRLTIHPKDWQALKANPASTTYYPCDFQWRGVKLENVGIRQRGGSTRNAIKPGLRVDFNRYETRQVFLGLKSLALDNHAQDASMIKERLTMELFAKLGLPASREAAVRLYVNDEYVGLYTIIESIDKDFLSRVFKEDSGYLYEYSGIPYHFEYLGSNPSLYSPVYFDPKTHEKDPDPAPIEAMIRAMNTASDANFASVMASYLDLPLLMQHLAVEDYMAETDGILAGMNNFDLYRFSNTTRSQFIPRDKDLTFGGPPNISNRYATPFLGSASKNVLIRRAMNVPEARDAYFRTLATVSRTAGGSGGWLESEINRMYAQIRTSVYEDQYKVCFDGLTQQPCTNAAFESEVAADREFVRRRYDYAVAQAAALSGEVFFAISDLGGYAITKGDATKPLQTSYAEIKADMGSVKPRGMAMLVFRQNGIVISETAIPAVPSIQHGIIYAEIDGPIKTGLAIANPGDQDAVFSFSCNDSDGRTRNRGITVISAGTQMAHMLDDDPFNCGGIVRGTLTYDASAPIHVAALRGLTNERSEFLLSTVPVVDSMAAAGAAVIPHFADGGGWRTEIILLNPGNRRMQGTLQFADQDMPGSSSYTIAAGSYYRFVSAGSGNTVHSGSVRIIPDANGDLPAAFEIISFRKDGIALTECALESGRASGAYRMYAEALGNVQTGMTIANPSPQTVTVNLEGTTLAGTPTGLSGSIAIPENGRAAIFLPEIPGFETLAVPFQGILRISTTSPAGVVVAGLRSRTNERSDVLITGVPVVDESAPPPSERLVLPHVVEGGGYSTQIILFSGAARSAPKGVIRLYDQLGRAINAW